jgi:hypothetical protein
MGKSYVRIRTGVQRRSGQAVAGVNPAIAWRAELAAKKAGVPPVRRRRSLSAAQRRIAWMKKRHALVKLRLRYPEVDWKD